MDSDYAVRLATLEAMGGNTSVHYNSVYDIDLAILALIEQGGGGGGGSSDALTPDSGFNYATKYIDDDTGLEGQNIATGSYSNFAEGSKTKATAAYGGNHAEGYLSEATGDYAAHAEGYASKARNSAAHAEGSETIADGSASHTEGVKTVTSNFGEHAEGIQNVSHRVNTSTTNAGNTRHSIGIGDWENPSDRKNAVEVMANGDVYIYGIGNYVGTDITASGNNIKSLQAYIAALEAQNNNLQTQIAILEPIAPPSYQLWYTSTNGSVVTPANNTLPTVLYNTYVNGKGVIKCAQDITSIGREAFSNCTSLTSVTIPNSVTSIGRAVFWRCSGLTSVTIPNSVTSIDIQVFSFCTSLTSVTIPNSVTSMGGETFYECSSLSSVNIPNNVTSIERYTFYGCSSLTSVTIPNSVTSIKEHAFHGCTGLTSIEIPNSVTSIVGYAFSLCTGLTSVTIPNSVTSIGDYAFDSVTEITLESTTPISLEDDYGDIIYAFGKVGGGNPDSGSGSGAASGSGSGAASGSGSGSGSGEPRTLRIYVPAAAFNDYYNSQDEGWQYYRDYLVNPNE